LRQSEFERKAFLIALIIAMVSGAVAVSAKRAIAYQLSASSGASAAPASPSPHA